MKYLIFILFTLGLVFSVEAQNKDNIRETRHLNLSDNMVAIQGYDPVSYFSSDTPQKGNEDISHVHEGVMYYFLSRANLMEFEKNPEKFEPAYGGWCAYAMGKDGSKVKVNPETYKIINNKIYLFYDTFFVNTLPKWNKDEFSLKEKADANWKEIIQ